MSFFNGVTPEAVANAPDGFREFNIGDNEAYILRAEEKISKESDRPMLEITFANAEGAEIRYYIVDGEYKTQKLKQLCLCFDIPFGSTEIGKWKDKTGIVVCKQGEPYNGKTYNKVSYLKPLVKRESAAQPQPTGQPVQYPAFDDDIPF